MGVVDLDIGSIDQAFRILFYEGQCRVGVGVGVGVVVGVGVRVGVGVGVLFADASYIVS